MKHSLSLVVGGALLIAVGGCSKKLTGPQPVISGVTPLAVCQTQLTTEVALSGEGLSPLYTGALAKGQLEIPRISLSRMADTAGTAASGAAIPVPDNAASATGDVRWTSAMSMAFSVKPTLALQPGLYDIAVTNANGKTTTFPAGLLAVPPPSIAAMGLGPDLLCGSKQNLLTVTGDFFIRTASASPTITFTNPNGIVVEFPVSLAEASCRTLAGPAALSACTSFTVSLPAGALVPGNHAVVVRNPTPVGCDSKTDSAAVATAPMVLTIVPEPVVTSLAPEALCAADNAVMVAVTGTGFLSVNGVSPQVMVGDNITLPATLAGCAAVTGPAQTVQTCTMLTFAVPAATVGGSYKVRIVNPAPADCASAPPEKILTIFDRPLIEKVEPLALCAKVATSSVVITGNHFVSQGTLLPTVTVGDKPFVPTLSGCTDVPGPTVATKVCTKLTIEVKPPEFSAGKQAIVVTNPAPVGCANLASAVATLNITTPPTLTSVTPATVCAGSATIKLVGTNFSAAAKVKIGTAEARKVTVNAAGTMADAEFAGGLTTGGPYDVTIENGTGCGATATMAVTVIEGPQIFFVDPEIVYNGLNLQATVYGAGLTGTSDLDFKASLVQGDTEIPLAQPVVNKNQVLIRIPKGTAAGTYTVKLRDATSCPALLPDGLRITDVTTLQLAGLKPAFGWKDAATAVTISSKEVAMNDFKQVPRVYLNPVVQDATTLATPLGAVSYVGPRELTALVPAGLAAGKYDVIVVNPDGKVGVLAAGFEITTLRPPTIASLSPGTVSNANPQTFKVLGQNFRTPTVALNCVDGAGAAIAANPAATVAAATAQSIDVSFNASTAGVACVVTVTNGDDKTVADFSALVITNPSQNLHPAKLAPELAVGRRGPVVFGGDASPSARFVHVAGGDNNAGVATDSIESASLSLLGVPNAFAMQKNKMTTPRALAGAVSLGRFVYVAGGANGETRHKSIERAAILDPETRTSIADLGFKVDEQGLTPGVRYYRVAAVMKADDAFNPGGENLPSDPFPVRIPALGNKKLQITIVWAVDPKAEKYRVYRTVNADDPAANMQLIAEVAAPLDRFTDLGAAPIAMDQPMPVGSLGRWQVQAAQMSVAREGLGVALAEDPATPGSFYLYTLGGRSSTTLAANTFEFLPITVNANGTQTVAPAFVAGTSLLSSTRWQVGASAATPLLSPNVPVGSTYVYLVGGMSAAGVVEKAAEAAVVKAGGQLDPFIAVAGNAGTGASVAGAPTIVAANLAFSFGGQGGSASSKVLGAKLCGGTPNACSGRDNQPPYVVNFNSGQDMLQARYLSGGALSGAFIYIAGGLGTGDTVLKSVEYRIW